MTVRAFTFGRDRFTVSGEGYGTEGEIARASGGTPPDLAPLRVPAVLCNDSALRDGQLIGDPTEGALVVLAGKAGLDVEEIRRRHPRIAELPFDSMHKFMATAHRQPNGIQVYVKGVAIERW
jgi:P-type Ca2+ transporter type 2C